MAARCARAPPENFGTGSRTRAPCKCLAAPISGAPENFATDLLETKISPMFLFHLAPIMCLSEMLQPATDSKAVAFVVSEANTVHYIQSKAVMEKDPKKSLDEAVGRTVLHIYRDAIDEHHALVYKDEKHSAENTFFFTTPTKGKYFIVLSLEDSEYKTASFDYRIYSGEANRPAIVSNNDVEVSKAEFRIRKLLEYVRNNMDLQNMDYDDNAEYRKIYSYIAKKALFVVCFKIVATVVTLMYSNWKTKKFFSSQGVVGQND